MEDLFPGIIFIVYIVFALFSKLFKRENRDKFKEILAPFIKDSNPLQPETEVSTPSQYAEDDYDDEQYGDDDAEEEGVVIEDSPLPSRSLLEKYHDHVPQVSEKISAPLPDKAITEPVVTTSKRHSAHYRFDQLSASDLKRAIVLSEILSPCVAKRRGTRAGV